jgi:soluble lytic murein transglycosylase-like protein
MKLTIIALLVGCTAVVCAFAVQSELFHTQALGQLPLTPVKKAANVFELFPQAPAPAPPSPDGEIGTVAPSRTLLSKAETLILISGAAAKHGVPAAFVASIVAAESNFDCSAVSPKGAVGLMQLMPETARQFGADPAVPAQNIDAGTRYLRWLMERYQTRRNSIRHVIAAYNAGPGMVDRYRGVPPFRETRNYVARVLNFLKQFSPAGKRGSEILARVNSRG